MPRSRQTIDEKLEALDHLNTDDVQITRETLSTSLKEKHYRIVAKAAKLCAEHLLYEFEENLIRAYQRFLKNPIKTDPNCIAKRALSRAFVDLDGKHLEFYLAGLQYKQLEPVWGGSVDTAADIRASCAMGLVATGYSRALQEITLLLNDPEPAARLGAVRAMGCGNPNNAELLLRSKALADDDSAEVTGECFYQLLSVEPDYSLAFIALFLNPELIQKEPDAVREHAALALGESKHPEALAYLRNAWDKEILDKGFRQIIIRAASLHRSDEVFNWLLSIVENENTHLSQSAVDALQIYQRNKTLMEKLNTAINNRKDRGYV
jgi:HEAT repeat protein